MKFAGKGYYFTAWEGLIGKKSWFIRTLAEVTFWIYTPKSINLCKYYAVEKSNQN